ncbi:MAG: hypothetical protein GC154_11745 [bacterium]|nr:hypothetical protein [bacterium]
MHHTTNSFWRRYNSLPEEIRNRTDKRFALLRENPRHPSLHFKKVGNFWSVRIDLNHQALAVPDGKDFIWVWIGSHDEYEKMIGKG